MEKKEELAQGFLGLVKAMSFKFIPDVVEFRISRHENEAELYYKECFTYLPKDTFL